METQLDDNDVGPGYQIWGPDFKAYGPVELPALVKWIKEERVLADTWVFAEQTARWAKASEIPELKMFFKKSVVADESGDFGDSGDSSQQVGGIKPGSLRRIKIFAEFGEDELARFLQFMEIIKLRPFAQITRRGDPGGAMYLVLEGELRSSIIVDDKETPVASLPPGNIFGEVSLLDGGSHAADVFSNQESIVMKISAEAFDRLIREAPELASPFLLSLSKSIAGRVRMLTKRYEDSVMLSQGSGALQPA